MDGGCVLSLHNTSLREFILLTLINVQGYNAEGEVVWCTVLLFNSSASRDAFLVLAVRYIKKAVPASPGSRELL